MRKLIITIFSVVFIISSCSEEFLDKMPLAVESNVSFYSNEKAALQALTAAYDPLGWNKVYTSSSWVLGNICSDDSEAGGEFGGGDQMPVQNLSHFRHIANNEYLTLGWQNIYVGIYCANLVTSNVPDIEFDTDENPIGYNYKERIIAEAKFIRALFYFNLVNIYGGVPLFDKPLEPSEYEMGKATKEEVWGQIEKDLEEAIPNLPEKSEYNSEDLGRATKGAAKALLMKSYIYQAGIDKNSPKWQLAKKLGAEIINSGEYSLDEGTYIAPWGEEVSAFLNIFLLNGEHGAGSIFEISYANFNLGGYADGQGWGTGNEGNNGIVFRNSRGEGDKGWGWGFDCPTQDLIDAFEPGDPRLESTVIRNGDVIAGEEILNPASPTGNHNRKVHMTEIERPSNNAEADNNVRVIRYADVLLFYAESAYYTGNEQEARDKVNMVRKRARNGLDVLPDINSSGNQLLKDIWHERRVELAMECHRFWDLVRTDQADAELSELGFVKGKHEVFPIPEIEITLSNGNLEQNPGY